jgi:hypothetical protein
MYELINKLPLKKAVKYGKKYILTEKTNSINRK